MTLKKLPLECISPLRLKEITLHGIGSYLRPARLEIRPLTILCGPNGCGKSTWIKVLDLLSRSADNDGFPVSLIQSKEACSLFNFVAADIPDDRWPTPDWDSPSGPLGSIGMVFECTKQVPPFAPVSSDLPPLPTDVREPSSGFNRGDVVRLRWTCQYHNAGSKGDRFVAVRVTINGDGLEWRTTFSNKPKESGERLFGKQWSLLGVKDAPAGDGRSHSWVFFDSGEDAAGVETDDFDLCCKSGAVISEPFRTIMRIWKNGFFHISAIRQIQTDEKTTCQGWNDEEVEDARRNRWVGAGGERTHLLRAAYQFNAMLDPRRGEPYLCPRSIAESHVSIDLDTMDDTLWAMLQLPEVWQRLATGSDSAWPNLVAFFRDRQGQLPSQHSNLIELAIRVASAAKTSDFTSLAELFAGYPESNDGHMLPRLRAVCYIWPRERDTLVAEATKRLADVPPGSRARERSAGLLLQAALKGLESSSIGAEFDMIGADPGTDRATFGAVFQALRRPLTDIFQSPDFVGIYVREVERQGGPKAHLYLPNHIRWLYRSGLDRLSTYENAFLRYWAMRHLDGGSAGIRHSYCADVQLLVWLRRLDRRLKLRMLIQDGEEADVPLPSDGMLAGYLGDYRPNTSDRGISAGPHWFSNEYIGPGWCSVAFLSAGIHQVLPMLVQYNVMKMNELCAVENPEVHLHPGMQLKFTEVFIENAKIGKFGLLETHSDLLIRRVLRAMREEDIRGAWVNICFVHGEGAPEYERKKGEMPQSAVAEPLRIEQGRIANWPEGFLDDDTKESEALLRSMYGRSGQEEEQNEPTTSGEADSNENTAPHV